MVVPAYYPFQEKGGPVVKVRALARGLYSRGHHVTVLTPDLGVRNHTEPKVSVKRCAWGWRSEQDGVEVVYLSTFARYRALTLNPRVIGFCRSYLPRFELVHFYGLYDLLGPIVSYVCRRKEIPYVIEPMGMYRPIDRAFRLKAFWHRAVGGAFWRKATQIIATSEMEHQELLDDGVPAARLVIRYNGIEKRFYEALPQRGGFRSKWGVSRQEVLLLFLGRLIPRKGADILIEAFARVCPERGRLVIAGPQGEPGYRAYLEKRAREAGVRSRVIFTGPVYDEEKMTVLADADLFVLPSSYENFANAAAEAVACGVPVVVSSSCGIGSLVNEKAGLVVALGIEALTEALQKLIEDQALYRRLKEGCPRVAADLSWERLTQQMEGHYAEVLAETHGLR
jgi:glycosyltransferase involved in cell wall biosynthesis